MSIVVPNVDIAARIMTQIEVFLFSSPARMMLSMVSKPGGLLHSGLPVGSEQGTVGPLS